MIEAMIDKRDGKLRLAPAALDDMPMPKVGDRLHCQWVETFEPVQIVDAVCRVTHIAMEDVHLSAQQVEDLSGVYAPHNGRVARVLLERESIAAISE